MTNAANGDPSEEMRLAVYVREVSLALIRNASLADMLADCADLTIRHLDAAFARIWTVNEAGDLLELQASVGMYTHIDGPHSRIPVGKFKIGMIAEGRKPHLTNAVIGDPRVGDQEWARREGMVAFAGYPLVVEDRLIGVLAIFARHALSDAALLAMGAVANGIALGVEQRRAAESVRKERAWLATVLASIGDAVIATDGEGRVGFMNPVAEALTGWAQHEAAGRSVGEIFRIVNEHTRQPVEPPVGAVIREGVVVGLANHTVLIARDGTETAVEDSAAPIRDDRGGVTGVVMVFRDASEQRRHEAELRASEERHRAMLESITDAFFALSRDWRFTYLNRQAETLLGRSHGDLDGKSIWDEFAPALGTSFEQNYRRAMDEGTTVTFEAFYPPHDRWYEVHAYPSSEGLSVYFRDISDRKRAEAERERLVEQVDAERRHLRTLIESSRDCIKELDLDGRLVSISHNGQRLLEIRDLCDVLDKSWIDFWRGEDREAAGRAVSTALAGGVGSFEGYCPTAAGTPKWWDVVVTPILDAGGMPHRLLSVSRDITERRRHQEERERLLDEAQEANRAKTHFLAVLSHELRTPLNPILLAVTSMLDAPTPPEEVGSNLEMIRQNVNLQARLIDDLLDVMRIVRGKMPLHWEVADCHSLVRQATQICQSDVRGKEIRLGMDLGAKNHYVNADPARFQQVIWNLIKNAIKFTPDGGAITIRSRNEQGDRGESLVIEVSDTGIGIEPEILPLIFDPFQQGETRITRKYGGLGLGLAICKGIVESHGGTLGVESMGKDRGTVFEIRMSTIPNPAASVGEPTGDSPKEARTVPSCLKLLVVEDEPATLRLMARLLRGLGHEVTAAGTVADALSEARSADFDLIVSDIGLPDGSGLELMRQVVARRGPVPAIALTGYGMEEDIQRSREAGFTAHLTKPIDFTKLEAMIRQVVG